MHTQILFKPGALSPADAMVGLGYPCVTKEEKRLAFMVIQLGSGYLKQA